MCDTIQEKCEKAVAKKHSGYNCAQAVACTFCEEAGLDCLLYTSSFLYGTHGCRSRCRMRGNRTCKMKYE